LRLIRKWLKAGILEPDGTVNHPEKGSPQGGIVSPILANIYLHYGSSRQGCESRRVKVPSPSVARNGRLAYPLLGEVTN